MVFIQHFKPFFNWSFAPNTQESFYRLTVFEIGA